MRGLALVMMAALLAACTSYQNHAPLIFGQAHSLGVNVGANPATQTPEIAVGYKDVDIAVIPTVRDSGDGLIQGQTSQDLDAYSTFGQFSSTTKVGEVGLGTFFATGLAARYLAQGFGCDAAGGKLEGCPK